MLAGRKKQYYVVGGVLSGVLLCFVGALATINWWQKTTSCYNDRPPLSSFAVTVDASQQKKLIEQFQEFADKNSFKFGIAYYTPNHEEFLIDLTRHDTEVIGSNTSINLDKYLVTFHNNDCIHPTVASDIVDLVSDLESHIREIPSAIITEEKYRVAQPRSPDRRRIVVPNPQHLAHH